MNHGHSPGAGQPETPKLPHAVFISYASQDKVTADGVCATLEAAGPAHAQAAPEQRCGTGARGAIGHSPRNFHAFPNPATHTL